MAIVINGSGTVTGISVGGLPDDIVDAGTLADNAVGLAQMAGGTDGNVITYDASGNPAVVATGSSGEILTSAGAGAAPTMVAGNTPSWGATMSANQTISHQVFTKVAMNTEGWDTDSAYDTSNYKFVVPAGKAGRYLFTGSVEFIELHDGKFLQLMFRINDAAWKGYKHRQSISFTQDMSFTMTALADLDVADYVELFIYHNKGDDRVLNSGEGFFGGFKI